MEYIQYFYEKIFGEATDFNPPNDVYYTPRKVVCFGNVLLDRIVNLDDTELLQRFDLQMGSKGEMSLSKLNEIVTAACSAPSAKCLTNPGGSALNTTRILKRLGTEVQFFGAVGADKQAEQLREIFQDLGIEARLQTIDDVHTGQCVCLMYEDNPTLYANIGASAHFSLEQLTRLTANSTQTFLRPIDRKQVLYIEGFFVSNCAKVCDYIAAHFIRDRRRLALNLSAPYIARGHADRLMALGQHSFFIFGNRQEFEALCAGVGLKSINEVAVQLIAGSSEPKIIVITNGACGAQLITNYVEEQMPPGETRFEDYRASRVEKVVDATGAGDAFVAGFLHSWLEKRSLSECMRQAIDVGAKVVTQVGCNLP